MAETLDAQAAALTENSRAIREQVKDEYERARRANSPEAYREALVRVRSLQDQLEEYVAFAITVKGGLERTAADAKDAYDEAWAAQADGNAKEWEGPRERYAKYDVKVFHQLRYYRQAQKTVILAGELLDFMWLRYRAVNATRDDLANILRAYAFESTLDRL